MTNTVFYKKQGDEYIPVSEYDSDLASAIPYDCCIIEVKRPNSTMRRYKIDPALAPMVAASMILEDKLCSIINEASRYKLPDEKRTLTPEQLEAWQKLNMTMVYGPSMRDVAENILKVISAEAEKLLANDSIKAQYDYFLDVVKLTAKEAHDEY